MPLQNEEQRRNIVGRHLIEAPDSDCLGGGNDERVDPERPQPARGQPAVS